MTYRLFLSHDSEKNKQIQSSLTDEIWQTIEVDYDSEVYLLLEDGSKIQDLDLILALLRPSLSFERKIKNLGTSFKNLVKAKVGGEKILASNEEINKRRAVCKDCPFSVRSFYGKVCSECGCNIKAKTSFLTEECPKGKW